MVASPLPLRALSRLGDWFVEERAVPGPPWPLNVLLAALVVVSPLPAAALILQEATPLFWLVLILDLLLLFAVALATFRRPAVFVGIIILWFALQRLVIALIAPHVNADVVRLLLTYKEGFYLILLAAAAATLVVRYLRDERALPPLLLADLTAVAFLGLLALNYIASPQTSSPELTYLRRFAAPLILYLAGRLLIPRSDQFADSLRLVILVGLGVALFGFIERFLLDISFWRDNVDAATFYARQVEAGLLPADWTVLYRGVPDGIFIGLPLEVPVRRLVSTYLEPTTLGSFLAFATLLLFLVPNLSRGRSRLLAGPGVLLLAFAATATLSRGAMLTLLAALALFSLVHVLRSRGRGSSSRLPSSLIPVLLALPLAVMVGAGLILTTFSDPPAAGRVREFLSTEAVSGLSDEPVAFAPSPEPPSSDQPPPLREITVHPPGSTAEGASTHLGGLTSGLEQMLDDPLGLGLGAAGNWSRSPEAGGESTAGAVAAQLGWPGFLLFLAFFASVIASLILVAWRQTHPWPDVALALAAALFGLFLVSFFSESASGLLGNAFYFLFAGWALALASPSADRPRFRWLPPAPAEDD